MDAWQTLAENTTTGDAWTRLNELLTVLPGKHVYQAEQTVETTIELLTVETAADPVAIETTETPITISLNDPTILITDETWQIKL